MMRPVIAGVLAAEVGLTLGAPAGAVTGVRTIDRTIAYACTLPSGTHQVRVRFEATLPTEGVVGAPIVAGRMAVTLFLPSAATTDLAGAATVGGVSRLTTLVTQNGAPAPVPSAELTIPDTRIGDGNVALTASGSGPSVTVATPGDAVYSAAEFGGTLTLRKDDGTAAEPAKVPISCAPNLGQDTALATVPVTRPAVPATRQDVADHPDAGTRQVAAAQEDFCPPEVTGGFSEDFPLPTPPEGADILELPPLKGCAKVSGFSNVAKLNGAAPLFGKAALAVGNRVVTKLDFPNPIPENNYFELDSLGVLHMETRRATFLTFGFLPTTAELEITQVGKATAFQNSNITAVDYFMRLPDQPPRFTTASSYVSLRVHDVQVNGVPLDVGPDCRTAEPMKLQVSASTLDSPPYVVNTGGDLRGMTTIPPFHGCGVGEDLDPIFTASISGPGNYVSVTQGQICDPAKPLEPNSPCPVQDFGWDITPGGDFTAAADSFRMSVPGAAVSCRSASFHGHLEGGKAVNGGAGDLGDARTFAFQNCPGEGALTGPVTISSFGRQPFQLATYDPATEIVTGELGNWNMRVRSGTSCSITIGGHSVGFTYSNVTHVMALRDESSNPVTTGSVTGCGGLVGSGVPVSFSGGFLLDVPQKLTRPL